MLLVESHDVVILSEHWLWPFETHKFLDLHPCMTVLAIPDGRLTPECNLSKGCGGIGVLWRKQLKATPVSEVDSNRVCAISIKSTYTPIIIIGVYLPTTNSPLKEYYYIITGDFNAHVVTEGGPRGRGEMNVQGEFLMDLICRNDLYISSLSCLSSGP